MRKQGVGNLSGMSESFKNTQKIRAIADTIGRKRKARHIRRKLSMTSKQVGAFMKRIDEVNRDKGGDCCEYHVDVPEIPKRIEYGDKWVEVTKVNIDGKKYRKIETSEGDERFELLEVSDDE